MGTASCHCTCKSSEIPPSNSFSVVRHYDLCLPWFRFIDHVCKLCFVCTHLHISYHFCHHVPRLNWKFCTIGSPQMPTSRETSEKFRFKCCIEIFISYRKRVIIKGWFQNMSFWFVRLCDTQSKHNIICKFIEPFCYKSFFFKIDWPKSEPSNKKNYIYI